MYQTPDNPVRQQIAELRATTVLTTAQIAEQLGISVSKALVELRQLPRLTAEEKRARRPTKHADKVSEVVELRRAGKSIEEIVALTGVPQGSVRAYCSTAGVILTVEQRRENGGRAISEEQVAKIEAMRAGGLPVKEIVAATGVCRFTVKRYCKKAGVTISKEQVSRNLSAGRRHVVEHYRDVTIADVLVKRGGVMVGTYIDSQTKIGWRCADGHEWQAKPNDVTQGQWCPTCFGSVSQAQRDVHTFVSQFCPDAVLSDRTVLEPLELDVWVPQLNLGIEYDGLYWHGERHCGPEGRLRGFAKRVAADSMGVRLVTVFEDEWVHRRQAVEGYLRGLLGGRKRVGGRECSAELLDKEEARDFAERWHLQGAGGGESWGLRRAGELLAVATFARPNASRARAADPGLWELSRYVAGQVGVQGGLSKLVAAWRRSGGDKRALISYSDRRWASGGVYLAAGFVHVRTNRPSYWYFPAGSQGPRFHRYTLRKSELLRRFGGDPAKTEWQLAVEAGYDRVWDAGTELWRLDFSKSVC